MDLKIIDNTEHQSDNVQLISLTKNSKKSFIKLNAKVTSYIQKKKNEL